MRKKTIAIVAASLMLTSCGSTSSETQTADTQPSATATEEKTTAKPETTTEAVETITTASESEATTTATETTAASESKDRMLYDANGLKIMYKQIGEGADCAAITVEIENSTDKDIMIQTTDFSVNDFMCRAAFSEMVLAGKKCVANIRILDQELQKNGIGRGDIQKVEFRFTFCDQSFLQVFENSDVISLEF